MKKLALLLVLIAFAATAAVLVPFLRSHLGRERADAAEEPTKKGSGEIKGEKIPGEEPGDATIKLDRETQERIALAVQPLAPLELRPQLVAYGRAIDPAPLAVLDGDITAADAALQASEAASSRARTLFDAGENVARKAVETAALQFQTDQSRAQALHRRLALEWGVAIAALDEKERGALLDRLVQERAALIRVDVPGGESVKEDPLGAKITVLGREDQPIAAAKVTPASSIDPKVQAQGFLLQVESPPFPVRAGVAVTAYLELPDAESHGVIVPRSAIVRYAGETWAYVQGGEEAFERRRVPPGQTTEDGWFVTEGFKPGDKVVVTGAQTLLSSELAPQSAGAAD